MEPIMSDNPKAVELLQEKLQKMEDQSKQMKSINKQYKKAVQRAEVDKSGSIADYLGAFMEETGYKTPHETCVKLVSAVTNGHSWEKQPYPKWKVSNLGANIRTVKKRIEKIEVVAKEVSSEYELNGVRVFDNCEYHRLQLFFNGKPEQAIRLMLKKSGFRWSPTNECWQSYRGRNQNATARTIISSLTPNKVTV